MKFVGKNSLSFYIKWLILIFMVVTILTVIFLPWIVEKYLYLIFGTVCKQVKTILLIVLYPSGVLGLLTENELRRIFKSLEDKNPFVTSNVKSLNNIGIFLAILTAIFIYKIIVLNSILTMICAIAMIILSLFCFILADVFKQAVVYKQDNDLVI